MSNESIVKIRMESLRMAYDTNNKINPKTAESLEGKDDVKNYLLDIFSLSDINFEYITKGNHPWHDESEDGNEDI